MNHFVDLSIEELQKKIKERKEKIEKFVHFRYRCHA